MWTKKPGVGELIAWLALLGFVVTAFIAVTGGDATAAGACSGKSSDYNGDGVRDTAIADPEAAVRGKVGAGTITIAYGGGAGTIQLHQDLERVPGDAQADAGFGHALAQADLNGDGCSDLVTGAPYMDVDGVHDAGAVYVFYGSPAGLEAGPEPMSYDQGQDRVSGATEAGDLFGYAVTAGQTASGSPYLAIGVPGEDLEDVRDAGGFFYIRGSVIAWVDQDSPGVAGVVEQDDRLGASLAGAPGHLVAGAPGEAIGAETFAGAVWVFGHNVDGDGRPAPLSAPNQETPSVGAAEAGDRYGTALAVEPMPDTSGTYKDGSYLVVGTPGEDLGTASDAGSASVYKITASGSVSAVLGGLHQDVEGTHEVAETGDFFGQEVAASVQGSALRVAAGVPGDESSSEHLDKGGVQIFSITADGALADEWLDPGWGIPGEPAHRMFVGTSLAARPDMLLVGVAYEPGDAPGAVYGYDWAVSSGSAPTLTLKPGEGGIPAGGKGFGAEIR